MYSQTARNMETQSLIQNIKQEPDNETTRNIETQSLIPSGEIKEEPDYEVQTVKTEVSGEDESYMFLVINSSSASSPSLTCPDEDSFLYCEKCQMKCEGGCPDHGPVIYLDNAEEDYGEGYRQDSSPQVQVVDNKDRQVLGRKKVKQFKVYEDRSDDVGTLINGDCNTESYEMFSVCEIHTELCVACTSCWSQSNVEMNTELCVAGTSCGLHCSMNKVDFLLTTPFQKLSDREKLAIVQLGPDHTNVSIIQKHKTQSRCFSPDWYKRKPWLTASEIKKTLFCFNCLLFGGDVSWTVHGISDLKHLSERIKSHEISSSHIGNSLKLRMYGKVDIRTQIDEGYRLSITRHNELVRKNRHILNRIVDCLKFCGKLEIIETQESLKGGIFLDLVNEIAKLDNTLHEHLHESKVNKYTSTIIQNELLDCMYQVYQETLIKDVNKAMFVSIQADKTSDTSNNTQLVIVLRLIQGSQVVEHFHGFVQLTLTEISATRISQCILQALEQYKVKDKLISQTYHIAASFRGVQHGVQKLVRDVYPCAYFVHCYAHQLNLIVQQVCSTITAVRIFFANLSAFSSFFSSSSKKTDLLITVCHQRFPQICETSWNFQSRVLSSVFQCKEALIDCFEIILEDGSWDSASISEATGLIHFLEDEEFNFFLDFFNRIMPSIETFYNILLKKVTNLVLVKEHLYQFCDNIRNIRNEISNSPADGSVKCDLSKKRKRSVTNKNACAIECCDMIIQEAEERFAKTEHLQCFNLVDPAKFSAMKCNFPEDLCDGCVKYYPFIEAGKLKNELRIVYSSEEFKNINSVSALYSFLIENNLEDSFSETVKMSNIVLTTPVATAESERCFSTLERVKTYLRNKMGQDRLNTLAVLTIEKEYIANILNFNERVITKFAGQKNRRAEFLYK